MSTFLARAAYNAYKDLWVKRNMPYMPVWQDMNIDERDAWVAAAEAVAHEMAKERLIWEEMRAEKAALDALVQTGQDQGFYDIEKLPRPDTTVFLSQEHLGVPSHVDINQIITDDGAQTLAQAFRDNADLLRREAEFNELQWSSDETRKAYEPEQHLCFVCRKCGQPLSSYAPFTGPCQHCPGVSSLGGP